MPAIPVQVLHNVHPDHFTGYQPGHPLVRVFRADFETCSARPDPAWIAEQLYEAFNVGHEYEDHPSHDLAVAYRNRRLRSLSVGDVVVAGESPLHVASAGMLPVTGPITILTEWPDKVVTVIWCD